MIDKKLSQKENLERLIGVEIGKIEHKFEMAEKLIETLSHKKIMEITGIRKKSLKKIHNRVYNKEESLIEELDWEIGYDIGFEIGFLEQTYRSAYILLESEKDIENIEKITKLSYEQILKIWEIRKLERK